VPGCWLLAAGCWLLAAGCWLLAAGCWLLAVVVVVSRDFSIAGCSTTCAWIAFDCENTETSSNKDLSDRMDMMTTNTTNNTGKTSLNAARPLPFLLSEASAISLFFFYAVV
jgi:hypothetical protein